jgi:DNA-binding MarR family transcriptional regulator
MQPYKWIVTITPKGVLMEQKHYLATYKRTEEVEEDEYDVLFYLAKDTETGSQELALINSALTWNPSATRAAVKRLEAKKMVTIKFLHDGESVLSDV